MFLSDNSLRKANGFLYLKTQFVQILDNLSCWGELVEQCSSITPSLCALSVTPAARLAYCFRCTWEFLLKYF